MVDRDVVDDARVRWTVAAVGAVFAIAGMIGMAVLPGLRVVWFLVLVFAAATVPWIVMSKVRELRSGGQEIDRGGRGGRSRRTLG